MAIALDSSTSSESSFNNAFTLSVTVGAALSDSIMVVCVGTRETNDITGFTYNGDSLTLQKEQLNDMVCGAAIWTIVNPDSGTHDLVGSATEFNLWDVWVGVFTGVDQVTPIAATGGTNTFSDSISTTVNTGVASGDMAVDCSHTQNTRTLTVGADQTQRYNHDHTDAGQGVTAVSTESLSGASVTSSWSVSSADNWAQAMVVLKAASGASTVVKDIISMGVLSFAR